MHDCPRCHRNFESVSEMESHFRTEHTDWRKQNWNEELRNAQLEIEQKIAKEHVDEFGSPEQLLSRIEKLESRVGEAVGSLENAIGTKENKNRRYRNQNLRA